MERVWHSLHPVKKGYPALQVPPPTHTHTVTCGPAHPAGRWMVPAVRGRKKSWRVPGLPQPRPHRGEPGPCPSQGAYLSSPAPLNPKGAAQVPGLAAASGAVSFFLPKQLSAGTGCPCPHPWLQGQPLSPPTARQDAPPSTAGLLARAAAKWAALRAAEGPCAPLTLGGQAGGLTSSPLKRAAALLPAVNPCTPTCPYLPVHPMPQTSLAGKQHSASPQGRLRDPC